MSPGGYFAAGPCAFCGAVFTFNPELVPAIPVRPDGTIAEDGVKRPICEDCIDKVNGLRAEFDEPPISVLPGAYDVAEGFPP